MRIPRLSLNQYLQLALVLVLAINSVQHFTSPVYREYNRLCSLVARQSEESNRIFFDRTFPAFTNYVCAIASDLSSASVVNSNYCASVSSPDSRMVDHKDVRQSAQNEKGGLVVSSYRINGVDGFYYQGFDYRVGDMFFGSPIVYLSPTFVKTVDSYFVLRQDVVSPAVITNQSRVIVYDASSEPYTEVY